MAIDGSKYLSKKRENKKIKNICCFILSFLKKKHFIERKISLWLVIVITVSVLGFLSIFCFSGLKNTNRPAYIKDFVVYKEGQGGIAVYFVLSDEYGQPTAYDGWVYLQIIRKNGELWPLLFIRKKIKCSDFSSVIFCQYFKLVK